VGQHSSASASRLLDLDGFQVLAAEVVGGEWQLAVQTTAAVVGCIGCGVRAEPHGRRSFSIQNPGCSSSSRRPRTSRKKATVGAALSVRVPTHASLMIRMR